MSNTSMHLRTYQFRVTEATLIAQMEILWIYGVCLSDPGFRPLAGTFMASSHILLQRMCSSSPSQPSNIPGDGCLMMGSTLFVISCTGSHAMSRADIVGFRYDRPFQKLSAILKAPATSSNV